MPKAGFAEWDDSDAYDDVDERPSRRARRKPLPWLRMILLSAFCVTGLVLFARHEEEQAQSPDPKAVPASVLIAPAPAWKTIAPAPALYALEKAQGPITWEARQHTSGAREDTLLLGRFGEARHARITFIQGFAEPGRSFFVDLVRRAADAGLAVARNAQSRMVATKFGPVETASVTFAGPVEQNCQAFRFASPESGFGFQGWLCGSETRPADDMQLACLIDGVALAGGTNPSLKAVFVQAERHRLEACGPVARTASVSVKAPQRP